MYKATVNDTTHEIEASPEGWIVDNQLIDWDIVRISDLHYHIIYKNKSYNAEVVKADRSTKTFVFKINGKLCTVALKDRFELMLEKMGMNSSASGKINSIKAPMPGLVIDLKVKVGDEVNAGDPLLILEAMKMENILKSPGEGKVKTVKVEKGQSVEKGQILIEF